MMIKEIDFAKGNGLVPVIVQEYNTLEVLMLGYMNQAAYEQTIAEQRVTFYSRSKERLWTKGESSGHYLMLKDIKLDCDKDTLLVLALPKGPVCHLGTNSCFGNGNAKGFLYRLESTIKSRLQEKKEGSYSVSLMERGINKVAQKVGEEAVELVIEAKDNNDELFKGEAADLLYHFLLLLQAKGMELTDIEAVLKDRNQKS